FRYEHRVDASFAQRAIEGRRTTEKAKETKHPNTLAGLLRRSIAHSATTARPPLYSG
ncbi:MAG: hypothetical protein ACI9AX_002577, partial [Polaromonas sp.]